MGGMPDNDEGSADISELILQAHESFRRAFVDLWDLREVGDPVALAAAWQPLADELELHARAEETIFYPVLLHHGSDDAPAETIDAIGDHNEIRDAITTASGTQPGSGAWWDAVYECRKANDDHLGEEERDVIPDFRAHTDPASRRRLGAQWLTFHAQHHSARGLSDDIDPQDYVVDNS